MSTRTEPGLNPYHDSPSTLVNLLLAVKHSGPIRPEIDRLLHDAASTLLSVATEREQQRNRIAELERGNTVLLARVESAESRAAELTGALGFRQDCWKKPEDGTPDVVLGDAKMLRKAMLDARERLMRVEGSIDYYLNDQAILESGGALAKVWAKAKQLERERDELRKALRSHREKIREYLFMGGLFNPEMMEADKVRDMIIDIADTIDAALARTAPAQTGDNDTALLDYLEERWSHILPLMAEASPGHSLREAIKEARGKLESPAHEPKPLNTTFNCPPKSSAMPKPRTCGECEHYNLDGEGKCHSMLSERIKILPSDRAPKECFTPRPGAEEDTQ